MPGHIFSGIGLAPFFYPSELNGQPLAATAAQAAVVKRVQVGALAALLLALAAGWWWAQPARGARAGGAGGPASYQVFALVSLEVYLALFFATILVPYEYLAIVSIFFSMLLIGQISFGPARPAPPSSSVG